MNTINKPSTAPLAVIRTGLALVFLWFAVQQFLYTQMWISYIPDWVINLSKLDSTTLVHINGAFEFVFGMALLFGVCTRVSALLLGLHMAEIAYTVGYNAVGVRDFGLTIATIGIFLYGADQFCIDRLFVKEDETGINPPKFPNVAPAPVDPLRVEKYFPNKNPFNQSTN